jgi:hypothetical protein
LIGNNDDIKDNVFFHVDKNKTFYGKEEYFTSKDMILVSNWDNKIIHFWVAKDDFTRLDFK